VLFMCKKNGVCLDDDRDGMMSPVIRYLPFEKRDEPLWSKVCSSSGSYGIKYIV